MIPPLYPYASFLFSNEMPDNIFFLNSGQSSFLLIVKVLKKRYSDLIFLLPAYTCSTVVKALRFAEVEYNFIDLDETLNFDEDDLKEIVNDYKSSKVVLVPTFLFGSKIKNYKDSFPECIIIEDRAQSFPDIELNSSDYQFFSFGRGKMVSASGGGGVLTNDSEFKKLYSTLEVDEIFISSYVLSIAQKIILIYFWGYFKRFIKEDKEGIAILTDVKNIKVLKMSNIKIKWLINSIKKAKLGHRISISDLYIKGINREFQYELSDSIPYLRFPVKKQIVGDGISTMNYADTLSEAKKLRPNKNFNIPIILAEYSSMLPTHDLVSIDYAKKIINMVNND